MAKIHYRPYIPNQTVLFPQRIDEDIAENDPVRMADDHAPVGGDEDVFDDFVAHNR